MAPLPELEPVSEVEGSSVVEPSVKEPLLVDEPSSGEPVLVENSPLELACEVVDPVEAPPVEEESVAWSSGGAGLLSQARMRLSTSSVW